MISVKIFRRRIDHEKSIHVTAHPRNRNSRFSEGNNFEVGITVWICPSFGFSPGVEPRRTVSYSRPNKHSLGVSSSASSSFYRSPPSSPFIYALGQAATASLSAGLFRQRIAERGSSELLCLFPRSLRSSINRYFISTRIFLRPDENEIVNIEFENVVRRYFDIPSRISDSFRVYVRIFWFLYREIWKCDLLIGTVLKVGYFWSICARSFELRCLTDLSWDSDEFCIILFKGANCPNAFSFWYKFKLYSVDLNYNRSLNTSLSTGLIVRFFCNMITDKYMRIMKICLKNISDNIVENLYH